VTDGQPVNDFSPLGSIARNVALCPNPQGRGSSRADRPGEHRLAVQASRGYFRRMSSAQQAAIADRPIKLLNIATPTAEQPMKRPERQPAEGDPGALAQPPATPPDPRQLWRGFVDIGTKADIGGKFATNSPRAHGVRSRQAAPVCGTNPDRGPATG
jgi:hypothetical protein